MNVLTRLVRHLWLDADAFTKANSDIRERSAFVWKQASQEVCYGGTRGIENQ